MNPRLPKDKSLDGVLSRNPDPPPMNAGMPRGISLDAIKTMNARKRLMDMGPKEVMRLLGDTHEGDYRHLFDTETNPHAFRHGIQDAGADEIRQLIAEFQGAGGFDKVKKSKESQKEYVKSPCCPAGVGTRKRGGKIVCIDCEKELDAKAVLDMDRYHDYDEDGDGMYMRRSLDTDSAFDTAWELMKSDDKGDNAPTNPSLWAQAKSKARSKFKVYPSAYANAWASKWYKSKGGGWKKKGKKK